MSLAAAVPLVIAGVAGVAALNVVMILLVVIGAIYVAVKVSLSGPVIAIEKVYNPFKILLRSWQITKGNSLRLFFFYVLLFVVYLVIAGIVSAVVGIVLLAVAGSAATTVNAIVSAIIGAVFYLIFVAVLAAIHRQLTGPSAEAVSATFE